VVVILRHNRAGSIERSHDVLIIVSNLTSESYAFSKSKVVLTVKSELNKIG